MRVKAKSIIGLPIYTLQLGKKLEKNVKDVVYDPDTNRVEAFVLDEGGWFSDAKVILIPDVHSIGDDAVLIENEERIKKASDVKQKVASIAKGDNYLTTDKVITEDGKELGTISDLVFDSVSGNVEEFEVTQGMLKDAGSGKKTFKTTDIITVGEDAMIVGAYTDVTFDQQAQQKGIAGAVNTAKQRTPDLLDQVKQKTHELTEKTKEKVQEIKEHPKTQEMMQATKDKATQTKEATTKKIQQGKDTVEEKRKNSAMGKYLTVNILSQNDTMLARRGDMVTHQLLQQAEKNNALEQVLGNTTSDPPQQMQPSHPPSIQSKQTPVPLSKSKKDEPNAHAIIVESVEEEITPANYQQEQKVGTHEQRNSTEHVTIFNDEE